MASSRYFFLPETSVGKVLLPEDSTGFTESLVGFLCPVSAAILEYKLVNIQLFVPSPKKPDSYRPSLSGPSYSFPNVTLIDVDLVGAWEEQVLGPSMAIVADEVYSST